MRACSAPFGYIFKLDSDERRYIDETHKKNIALYQEFGLDQTATLAQIKQAYRKLALKHHPDKIDPEIKRKQEAREPLTKEEQVKIEESYHKIKQLNYVFGILQDALKKWEYDTFYLHIPNLPKPIEKKKPSSPSFASTAPPQPSPASPPETKQADDLGVYYQEIRKLTLQELRLLHWLDFKDTLPKWFRSERQDEELMMRNRLENAIKILGIKGNFYVSGDDVHFEKRDDLVLFEQKLRELPQQFMQAIADFTNNITDYLGIKTTVSTARIQPGAADYPVMCCFSNTKHLLFGIMHELKAYGSAVTMNKAQTVVTIDPNKLEGGLEKLEEIARKIRDYAIEELAPGYKARKQAAFLAIEEQGPQPTPAQIEDAPSKRLQIVAAQSQKPVKEKEEKKQKQEPSLIGGLRDLLFGKSEKKEIRPDEDSFIMYRTSDNMLAVEFHSTEMRKKFIDQIGFAELSEYQKKICPTAEQYSNVCPIIKKRGNEEIAPTTFFIPAVLFGQPPKQLAVALAKPEQSSQCFSTIGGPYNQSIGKHPTQPTLYFQDPKLLEVDARVKAPLSKLLFRKFDH